jgi:hypothetical protein
MPGMVQETGHQENRRCYIIIFINTFVISVKNEWKDINLELVDCAPVASALVFRVSFMLK